MFVAAYDDRARSPDYFVSFIKNTANFCDLHLITPDVKIAGASSLNPRSLKRYFKTINPESLPEYRHVKSLFDSIFINYSTNQDQFERACFHRWFALNALTISLSPSDYVCLLDTDFLLGISPRELLEHCLLESRNEKIELAAGWSGVDPVSICPEITIMTKDFLYGFCEFLLTTYFSAARRHLLIADYFERVGNGLPGGVCDMRALATYSAVKQKVIFNIRSLKGMQIIGNLNSFLASEPGREGDWLLVFDSGKQALITEGRSTPIIGTHFQGSAKLFMQLQSAEYWELSRSKCDRHLAGISNALEAWRNIYQRTVSLVKRKIFHLA